MTVDPAATGRDRLRGLRAAKVQVDHNGHVIAESGPAPIVIAADGQPAHVRQHLRFEKNVVDMIARPVLLAVAPIERRHALAALRLTAQFVIGTDQAKLGQ